jgi:Tol biopolymer transport system component
LSNGDLWLIDVESGALSLLAANAGYRPKWTRDGSRIVYMNGGPAISRVLSRPWDGSGADSVHLARPNLAEVEPGPVRGLSALRTQTGRDIFVAPTDSLSALHPFLEGPANETDPAISPDGKWLAYVSDETKQQEVYVRPLPGPGPRIPISIGGGELPRWSRDGSTIFYRGPSQFMAATLAPGATRTVVKREALFSDKDRTVDGDGGRWDVFPNGREFLFVKVASRAEPPSLYVLVNWQRLLGKVGQPKVAP